jgi:hypothetical protein
MRINEKLLDAVSPAGVACHGCVTVSGASRKEGNTLLSQTDRMLAEYRISPNGLYHTDTNRSRICSTAGIRHDQAILYIEHAIHEGLSFLVNVTLCIRDENNEKLPDAVSPAGVVRHGCVTVSGASCKGE